MPTTQDIPQWLYHGTSKANVWKIIKQGLSPRAMTGRSNWKHIGESHPDMVYLTAGFATYFGFDTLKKKKVSELGMVRISLESLDKAKLFPDEDFLAHFSGLAPADCHTHQQKNLWARNNLHLFQPRWLESLTVLGNCCYEGSIPPTAIDKAVIVNMKTGCGPLFTALLFSSAVYGKINPDFYSAAKRSLSLIDSYLFKEPFELDAWVKEFMPPSLQGPALAAMKVQLGAWLKQYSRTIKVLHIDRQ